MSDSNAIATAKAGWLTWDDGDTEGRARAMAATAKGLSRAEPVVRTQARSYSNVAPGNVSVRESFTRQDWESFRPDEAMPSDAKQAIQASMDAYKDCGIVHNAVDLMGDFAVQGIDLVHRQESVERFYKEWWRRVKGAERSERFLNVFYRCGNVIVRRTSAVIGDADKARMKSVAGTPEKPSFPEAKPRTVPWRYHFLNPMSVDLVCEQLAPFMGSDRFEYVLQVGESLRRMSGPNASPAEAAFLAKLPKQVRELLARGEKRLPLDPNEVSSYHYKRDDWSGWAMPMLQPVLRDVAMLEKMKLADLAALDGAISCIRVWKLGSLDHKLMPSEAVVLRLADMLNNNVGGGVMDLIWGPDIELLETSTEVHRFLGQAKYEPVLAAIYAGLGIPPAISGAPAAGGHTNNFLSLKTLTERLQYGRMMLEAFWGEEFRLVQKAMGFRYPAQLVFDRLLTDEAAEKKLLMDLADRDLVSVETLQERFGLTPEIEAVRARRELRRRNRGKMAPKASPFHDANLDGSIRKILAQSGAYSPDELGILLEGGGDESPAERQADLEPEPVAPEGGPKGVPGQGRPVNSKDSRKRKQKSVKPRRALHSFMSGLSWAKDALEKVSKEASAAYLAATGKKNLRELGDDEELALEDCKFGILLALPFGGEATQAAIRSALSSPLPGHPVARRLLCASVDEHRSRFGKEPTLETLRGFHAAVCALVNADDDEDQAS